MTVIAAKYRAGRVFRQVRRCLVANDGNPVLVASSCLFRRASWGAYRRRGGSSARAIEPISRVSLPRRAWQTAPNTLSIVRS
jgi:hypothetical protein